MAQAQGSSSTLRLIEETTWGITPTVTAGDMTVLPFASESLDMTQEREQNPHITNSRNYGPGVLQTIDCGGDTEHRLNPLAHGWLWKAVLGGYAVSGTGPYTHTFTVGNTLPSYTLEKGFTDISQYFRFAGMKAGQMRLRIQPSGFVETSVSWLGKTATTASSALDSAPTEHADEPFALAAGTVTLKEGGTTIAIVTSLEITIDNALDGSVYAVASGGTRAAIPAGKCRITGTLEAFFEDLSLYNKAANSTESSIEIVLQHGTGDGSAGNEKITITLPEILYSRRAPKVTSGDAGVLVELPFQAHYTNATEGTSCQVVLLNSVASY